MAVVERNIHLRKDYQIASKRLLTIKIVDQDYLAIVCIEITSVMAESGDESIIFFWKFSEAQYIHTKKCSCPHMENNWTKLFKDKIIFWELFDLWSLFLLLLLIFSFPLLNLEFLYFLTQHGQNCLRLGFVLWKKNQITCFWSVLKANISPLWRYDVFGVLLYQFYV